VAAKDKAFSGRPWLARVGTAGLMARWLSLGWKVSGRRTMHSLNSPSLPGGATWRSARM
jgi:hypothetical protein